MRLLPILLIVIQLAISYGLNETLSTASPSDEQKSTQTSPSEEEKKIQVTSENTETESTTSSTSQPTNPENVDVGTQTELKIAPTGTIVITECNEQNQPIISMSQYMDSVESGTIYICKNITREPTNQESVNNDDNSEIEEESATEKDETINDPESYKKNDYDDHPTTDNVPYGVQFLSTKKEEIITTKTRTVIKTQRNGVVTTTQSSQTTTTTIDEETIIENGETTTTRDEQTNTVRSKQVNTNLIPEGGDMDIDITQTTVIDAENEPERTDEEASEKYFEDSVDGVQNGKILVKRLGSDDTNTNSDQENLDMDELNDMLKKKKEDEKKISKRSTKKNCVQVNNYCLTSVNSFGMPNVASTTVKKEETEEIKKIQCAMGAAHCHVGYNYRGLRG